MMAAGNLEDAKAASIKSFIILEQMKDNRNFNEIYLDALKTRAKISLLMADFKGAKRPLVKFYQNKYSKKAEDWSDICMQLKYIIR